jgi:DNA-binding MarR family transcriptional regulator
VIAPAHLATILESPAASGAGAGSSGPPEGTEANGAAPEGGAPAARPAEATASPAFTFLVSLHRAGRALGATLGSTLEQHFDLDLRDFLALSMIRRGVRFPSELADGLEVPRDTASRIVHKLLERGLIDRSIDRDDSRRTLLGITEHGLSTRTAVKADIERTIMPLLDDLGDATRDCLTEALERVSQRLLEGDA